MPKVQPPFGLSVHKPKVKEKKFNKKKLIISRDRRASRKGRYLSSINWCLMFPPTGNSDEMWKIFHTVVQTGLDLIIRKGKYTVDAPWMNYKLKYSEKTFTINRAGSVLFKHYRNLVNRERKI